MPRLLSLTLLLLLAGGGPAASHAETVLGTAATDPLRLPESVLPGLAPLIRTALEGSPGMLRGRLDLLAAAAHADEQAAPLYPHAGFSLGADGRQEVRRDLPGIHYGFSDTYNLSVTQPLYHWDALTNQARLGRIQQALSENDFTGARRSLVLELRRQYTALILGELDYRQAVTADRRRTAHLQLDEERAGRGEVPSADLADERLAGEEGRLQLEKQAALNRRAREEFAVLLGRTEFAVADLPADIPPVPDWSAALAPAGPVPAGVVPAALMRPDGERESARLNLDIQRVRLRPTIDLVAGISQSDVSYVANLAARYGVQDRYIGVQVSWNIFDAYASEAAVRAARTELRSRQQAWDEATQALRRRLAAAWEDLQLAQRELVLAEARYRNATGRLEAARGQKEAGQLSDDAWQQRLADGEQQHLELQRLRAAQLLRVAEYALLNQWGSQPADRITFP